MNMRTYEKLFQDRDYPVLITTQQNIFYTVGFSTTARRPSQIGYNCVLLAPDGAWFFFPAGWQPLVQEQLYAEPVTLVPYQGSVEQMAERIVQRLGNAKCLGFEQDGMELNLYLTLRRLLKETGRSLCWTDVSTHLQRARLIKSPEEIQALRDSAQVAKEAMEYAKSLVRPGLRERDVVAELEYFMRRLGSEGVPFTMKALAGENALRTINLPGDYRIQEGDVVLLDFGAVVNHYASDWTRTFAVGYAGEEQRELYQLVWHIERACIQMIRPGVRFQQLMDQAMKVIHGHPYARWFNPYLGHSIGINSQEWPAIVPGAEDVLRENMVVTIEPGVYVPGVGGVRIEDEVLVTANGYEILTGLRDEEFVIGGAGYGEE